MLAMDVNDDAGILDARGALEIIASMLAPTGDKPKKPQSLCKGLRFFLCANLCKSHRQRLSDQTPHHAMYPQCLDRFQLALGFHSLSYQG